MAAEEKRRQKEQHQKQRRPEKKQWGKEPRWEGEEKEDQINVKVGQEVPILGIAQHQPWFVMGFLRGKKK
jgi:hypothetical protein